MNDHPKIPVEINGQVVGYTRLVDICGRLVAESIVIEPDGRENRIGMHHAPTPDQAHDDAAHLVGYAARRRQAEARAKARAVPSVTDLMDSIAFEE